MRQKTEIIYKSRKYYSEDHNLYTKMKTHQDFKLSSSCILTRDRGLNSFYSASDKIVDSSN